MSSVTTSKVDTINGTTDLTLTSGNTSGPKIVVKSEGNTGIVLGPNSTVNSFIVNTSGIHVSSALNVTSVSGNVTFVNSVTINSYVQSATLLTTGQANLNSLRVEGVTNAVGAFAMGNTLNVNGDVTFTKNLAVTGVTTSGNIAITGRLTTTTNVVTNTVIANTITAVNGSISSNSFTFGASSLSSNGYTRLPNGLLMQWGTVAVNTSSTAVNFPATFGTVYSVVATSTSTTTSTMPAVTAVTTTTATIRSTSTSSPGVNAYWMAIGT